MLLYSFCLPHTKRRLVRALAGSAGKANPLRFIDLVWTPSVIVLEESRQPLGSFLFDWFRYIVCRPQSLLLLLLLALDNHEQMTEVGARMDSVFWGRPRDSDGHKTTSVPFSIALRLCLASSNRASVLLKNWSTVLIDNSSSVMLAARAAPARHRRYATS